MSLHFGIEETIVFTEWVTNDNKSKTKKLIINLIIVYTGKTYKTYFYCSENLEFNAYLEFDSFRFKSMRKFEKLGRTILNFLAFLTFF